MSRGEIADETLLLQCHLRSISNTQSSRSPSVSPDPGCLLIHERNPSQVSYVRDRAGSTFGMRAKGAQATDDGTSRCSSRESPWQLFIQVFLLITHTLTGLSYNYEILNRPHIYRGRKMVVIMHRNTVKQNNQANGSVINCISPHNILGANAVLAPRCIIGGYWRAKHQSPAGRGGKWNWKITPLTIAFQNVTWRRHVRGCSWTSNFIVNKNADADWCVGGRFIPLGGNNPRWAQGLGSISHSNV